MFGHLIRLSEDEAVKMIQKAGTETKEKNDRPKKKNEKLQKC